jgi:hypothetical protein
MPQSALGFLIEFAVRIQIREHHHYGVWAYP